MLQYAVIGVGTLGKALINRLMNKPSIEVLAIDNDINEIEAIKNSVTQAMKLDSTQREALEAIEINKFDAVIVTIGEDIMTSILTSLILKELNVKNIIARYSDERHKAILSKIGITHLVSPEESMGIHIAKQLEVGDSLLLYDLTEYHSIVEFPVHAGLAGKNLKELDLRKKYKINVVAIKKETTSILGEKKIIVDCTPDPDESMVEGDILVIAGHDKDIEKLNRKLSE